MKKERQYLSELITQEEIESWEKGDVIGVTAGTGAGKSYFSINTIAKQTKGKVLLLAHRNDLKESLKGEVEKSGLKNIEVKTYQAISSAWIESSPYDLEVYDYIICDEAHYFIQDSKFNHYTDVTLKEVMKTKTPIKLFMSATMGEILAYLKEEEGEEVKEYYFDRNTRQIKNVFMYGEEEEDEEFLIEYLNDALNYGSKVLVYINNTEKLKRIYSKFKEHSTFNCSKKNKYYSELVDEEEIEQITTTGILPRSFLLTTSVMSTGVSLKDKRLKGIVINSADPVEIIQVIGRKRFNAEDEEIDVVMSFKSNRKLNGYATTPRNTIKQYREFVDDPIEYTNKYGKMLFRSNGSVYATQKGLKKNTLVYMGAKGQLNSLEEAMDLGFKLYIENLLDKRVGTVRSKKLDKKKRRRENAKEKKLDKRESYLTELAVTKKRLYTKEDKEEFIRKMDFKSQSNERLRGLASLRKVLQETYNGYFTLNSKRDERRVTDDGSPNKFHKKTYWEIRSKNDEKEPLTQN